MAKGRQTVLESATFTSCSFYSLIAEDNGVAICFGNSPTGTLTLTSSLFEKCSCTVDLEAYCGGGAVCLNSGYLDADSSTFIACSSSYFGGGILAQNNCISSRVLSCDFISCNGCYGGGLNTFFGPSATTTSSRFISCTVSKGGGGLYHDSHNDSSWIKISNCLFTNNCANYCNGSDNFRPRGGGAFEDYRNEEYDYHYSFSFFSGNTAPYGIGNDISIYSNYIQLTEVEHCFTTTRTNSLWNKDLHVDNWLPQANINVTFGTEHGQKLKWSIYSVCRVEEEPFDLKMFFIKYKYCLLYHLLWSL